LEFCKKAPATPTLQEFWLTPQTPSNTSVDGETAFALVLCCNTLPLLDAVNFASAQLLNMANTAAVLRNNVYFV
jgi:hypothetical protein